MTDKEKQPELIPAPRGELVLKSLRTYRAEISDQLDKAKDTVAKKKEEIELLEEELARIDASIKIVREDLLTPASPVEKPAAAAKPKKG